MWNVKLFIEEHMKITQVDTRTAPFSRGTWLDDIRIATPMSIFAEHAKRRATWRGPGSDLVWVVIRTDDPTVFGVGQSRGGKVTEALIAEHFADLLVGRDALALSERVEQLLRASQPYAEGGIAAMGISAVELALWDLAARAADLPLVRLLGGAGAPPPYYLTVPDPGMLSTIDADIITGAQTVKVPARWGPADGPTAVSKVIADLELVRAVIPAEIPLSLDCFMAWDVAFTSRVASATQDLNLDWIEEPLHPADFEGHRRLRDTIAPRIATGEHTFTLRDGRRLIEDGCVDIVQFDVTWCGGLDIARTLGRAAIDAGMLFAPHAAATQPWAVHLVGAFGPGVWLEVLAGLDGTVTVPQSSDGPGVGIDPAALGFA